MNIGDFYKKKRVFVTGHTGFKGSWLTQMLLELGADVTGYALDPPTVPSLFVLRQLEKEMHSVNGDIRDAEHLEQALKEARPEVLIHMAARSLVSEGYEDPVGTYAVNLMGTVQVLDAARRCDDLNSVLIVTTDKVYRNSEANRGFFEEDALGADDPYASSKACAEIATEAFRKSFLADRGIAVSTLRAGNVIGGGDFAENRLIPDCVRSVLFGEPLCFRYPDATRPYQHVPKPLALYLQIAAAQSENPTLAGAYNVGPAKETMTCELAERFFDKWDKAEEKERKVRVLPTKGTRPFKEEQSLRLDPSLAQKVFGWSPDDTIEEALEEIVEFTQLIRDSRKPCSPEMIRAHMEKWTSLYIDRI